MKISSRVRLVRYPKTMGTIQGFVSSATVVTHDDKHPQTLKDLDEAMHLPPSPRVIVNWEEGEPARTMIRLDRIEEVLDDLT